MKLKNLERITVILTVLIVVFCSSIFVYAEPDDNFVGNIENTVQETVDSWQEPETEDFQNNVTETEPASITEPEVTESSVVATESTIEETEPVITESTRVQATEPETVYETEYTTFTLPFANVIEEATAPLVNINERESGDFTYGVASWICVIIGVIVIMVVLISNKTQYHSGSGKNRYDEGNRITGRKRLLNDDYYNSRNAQSYYKGTRR